MSVESVSTAMTVDIISNKTSDVPRRKYTLKKGTKTIREMKKYQKSTALLVQRAPFKRLIKEVTQDYNVSLLYSKNALEAMQTAAEEFITERFQKGICNTIFSNRKTLLVKDIQNGMNW